MILDELQALQAQRSEAKAKREKGPVSTEEGESWGEGQVWGLPSRPVGWNGIQSPSPMTLRTAVSK
jgi:hypothetical protein